MKTLSFALITALVPSLVTAQNPIFEKIADELIAADREFSAASAKTDLVNGLSAMFAVDVAMPTPTGNVFGRQNAIEALRANPANAGATIEWTPARVGLSANGRHGFTAGFMTVRRADGTVTPAKYLAYWEKQNDGWRVLVYKRTPAKTAAPAMEIVRVLPKHLVASSSDSALIERERDTLAEAERSFSRDAQTMGIGPAFTKYGSADAINLGGPDAATFVIGNQAIGKAVAGGGPANESPVHWGPDKTIISAGLDFGVTIGTILRNQPGPDGKLSPAQPFFTIWRRDSTKEPWRYIAE